MDPYAEHRRKRDRVVAELADARRRGCPAALRKNTSNSSGPLGYALPLRVRLIASKPYVHVRHERFRDPSLFFERIAAHCGERRLDYLDGVVLGSGEMYLTSGELYGDAPQTSDYTWRR